jgi:hypothetical protein
VKTALKPFQTHIQQLRILRGRGLTVNNGSYAMRILENEGYYNVINGYKDLFLVLNPNGAPSTPEQPKNPAASVRLNKNSIVIKAGKFAYVNILTVPGNATVKILKFKCDNSTESPIVTLTQDKKNTRLLKLVPTTKYTSTQKLKIDVLVNNEPYTLQLEVKIDGAKVQPKKPAAKPTTTKVKK